VNGFVLPSVLAFLGALLLLGMALAVLATTEMSLADQERDAARAYYAAEAGALKAYHYLTRVAPDGTADGSWRTPGLTEPLATGEEYTMAVADGAGPSAGSILIAATGRANRLVRRVQLLVSPTGLRGLDQAIVTPGPVGSQGVVDGDVAALSVERGTQVTGRILGPRPLPAIDLAALRRVAQAQGTYFSGATRGRVEGGVATLTDGTGYRRALPTTFTTTSDDRTGAVHVIFIDDSAPGAGDGTLRVDGRYTIGGLIVALGTGPPGQPDEDGEDDSGPDEIGDSPGAPLQGHRVAVRLGGDFTLAGIVYTPGAVRLNGGGQAQNLVGAVLAGQGVTLNGNRVTVEYSPGRVARAAAASMRIASWREAR
jgi:hypothetical protein